jgi:type III pantothenate kinase
MKQRAPRIFVASIGNTSVFAGVFSGERLVKSFRLDPAELGQLARAVRGEIDAAAICSVVPALTAGAVRLVQKTWKIEPRQLTATSGHGLKIGYREPARLGADRVAAALGAQTVFPRRNIIVVDCGTATTVTALRGGIVLGGAIFPGLMLWPDMLATRTAQLPRMAPTTPRTALGRSPGEGIASGVFFGHAGAIRETPARVRAAAFGRGRCVVVATGGNAPRFAGEKPKLFDCIEPHLALIGLRRFALDRRD